MQRAEALKAAVDAVVDRGLNYGQPEDNFERIARLWNAHLANRGLLKHSYGVDAADVALMLANVKQARIAMDPNHADSWVDFIGYGACGAEVSKCGAETDGASKSAYEASGSVNYHPPLPPFGFWLGETVNLRAEPKGRRPGKVVGFTGSSVQVQWPDCLRYASYSPNELRHGV